MLALGAAPAWFMLFPVFREELQGGVLDRFDLAVFGQLSGRNFQENSSS